LAPLAHRLIEVSKGEVHNMATMKQKKIKYMMRRIPMCPYDSKDLAVHGGSSGFFFYCPGCYREWPFPEKGVKPVPVALHAQ
jgi:hypothetical protein